MKQLLVLDEALVMLEVVGVSSALREKFRAQAVASLKFKARGHVEAADGSDAVTVSSGFGQKSQRGFVELTINEAMTQMDPAKAREIGLMLLQGAEAAVSDEIFMSLMRDRVGITDAERLGRILLDLRELRHGTRGVQWPS